MPLEQLWDNTPVAVFMADTRDKAIALLEVLQQGNMLGIKALIVDDVSGYLGLVMVPWPSAETARQLIVAAGISCETRAGPGSLIEAHVERRFQ